MSSPANYFACFSPDPNTTKQLLYSRSLENIKTDIGNATDSVSGLVSTSAQTFGGDKTFTGNLQVNGYIKQTTASWCRGLNTSQNYTKIDWNLEHYSEKNCSYSTTNKEIKINISGRYFISFFILSNSGSAGFLRAQLHINNVRIAESVNYTSNGHICSTLNVIRDLNQNDIISVKKSGDSTIWLYSGTESLIYHSFSGFLIG